MWKFTRFIVPICLFAPVSLLAQATAGLSGITGTVRDSTGAVISGAAVLVENSSKGIKRSLVSNDAGLFNAPGLTPAAGYSVTVTSPGFARYQATDLQLQVGQNLDLSVTLQVSSATQQVEVTSEVPLVDVDKRGVSQVVNQAQIDELPINGRRVDTFVLLTPGVVNDGTFGLLSFRGIAGGNSFLTDGNDTTNQFYNENAGRTRISSQISQDAVQEFQVLSAGYSAEYGRATGGVVNTVTRSGTNDFHGTAYWFFRNRTLNATDRYANGVNPPEVRHQGGASLGGPIVRNKLFFFLNGEATYRNFPGFNRITDNRLFNADSSFNMTQCLTPVTSTLAATPAQCGALSNVLSRYNNVTVPRSVHQQLGFGKIDWHPTDSDSLSFSFNYLRWVSPNGIQTQAVLTNNNLISGNANSSVRSRYGRANWNHIVTPTQVNELRFGWFKDRLADDPNPALWPATGPLYISVYGVPVGAAAQYPRILPSENRFEIADNYSWAAGRHNLKFGFDLYFNEDYNNQLNNRFGSYTYNTSGALAIDFSGLNGTKLYNNFTQTLGNPILDFNTRDYDFYIQDQWRISPKFTWNWGLRYEYTSVDQPKVFNSDYPATSYINQPTLSFAPRAGFTYEINDKTLIRSGFGIYYARLHGALLNNLYLTNGNYQPSVFLQPNSTGSPVFPAIFPPGTTGLPTGSVNLQFADRGLRKPYTMQSDFAIERQLTRTMGLTVSYVWSRGVQFFTVRDLNAGPLSNDFVNYTVLNSAGQVAGNYATRVYRTATKLDPRYGTITELDNGGQTLYNALVVQLTKRLSHGIQGSVAYTYSHAIDNFGQGGGSDVVFPTVSTYYNGDFSNNKGTSLLDQRHRVTITTLWSPTFSHGTGWFSRYIANGWSLSQITTLGTPQPATATITTTSCSSAVPANIPCTNVAGLYRTNTINGLGGSPRVPFLPINSLRVDDFHRVDARLTKDLPFTERVHLNLLFEAFNVFNTISNTGVFTTAYTAYGNVLVPNSQLGQGNASQGFPDGTNARRMQVGARFVF